jgi:hypothetical protein
MVETVCRIQKINLAKNPSHDEEACASITSLARVTADPRAAVGSALTVVIVDGRAELSTLAADDSIVNISSYDQQDIRALCRAKSQGRTVGFGQVVELPKPLLTVTYF